MEKINRALLGVDDNARAIRELASRIGELAPRVNELASQVGELAPQVNELASQVGELASLISELSSRVSDTETAIKAFNIVMASGTVKEYNGEHITTFGKFKVNGPTVVIAIGRFSVFYTLELGGEFVASNYGTVIGYCESGEGELRFLRAAVDASVIFIGNVEKIGE